jgi:hypothetical protein
MFISDPLPFVASFIDEIDLAIKQYDSNLRLTRIQKSWLAFCIMAIYITRTVCWAKFERAWLLRFTPMAIPCFKLFGTEASGFQQSVNFLGDDF